MSRSDHLQVRIEGRVGRITLARPGALNALTYPMLMALEAALLAWRSDDSVAAVVLDAAGDRAFCAGGDVIELTTRARAGDIDFARRFWRDEYRVNASIGRYPKPCIAIMDGITMGGGVGIACHASHRIVTERASIAMPEAAIGLIPDVGGTWLLGRAPGAVGEYLAMTAGRLGPADALYAGFADHHVAHDQVEALVAALIEAGDVAVVGSFASEAGPCQLAEAREAIDACFGADTPVECERAVHRSSAPEAARWREAMARNSPLSMAAGQRMVRIARGLDTLEQCLALEFRFTYRSLTESDFLEGVRAMLVDKDRDAHWRHASLDAVSAETVDAMLAPLGDEELVV